MSALKSIILICIVILNSGCTYVVTVPAPDIQEKAPFPVSAEFIIPEQSAKYTHDVTSATAGAGNTFRIEVGEALVHYVNAMIKPAFGKGNELAIEITIEKFDVYDFEAHIDADFSVSRNGEPVFERSYHANGIGYYARTFWGGAFAMKSSMRNTTGEAMESLCKQFLKDADIEIENWQNHSDSFQEESF